MTRLWLDLDTESALLDEVTQRRQRLSAQRRTVLPQTALLAESYADAYPWMDPSAIQSFVQAGISPDTPQVQQVAILAGKQAKAARPIRDWLRSVARQLIAEYPDFARAWRLVFERELADDDSLGVTA